MTNNSVDRGMPSRPIRRRHVVAGLLSVPLQAWPQAGGVLKIVVPYPAGGVTDLAARLVGDAIAPLLGQVVIIENRPGAASRIGIESVARAPADGLTLLAMNTSFAVMPVVDPKLSFDPLKTFVPVALTGTYGLSIIVSTATPVRTLAEFITYARARPGKLSYGSSGIGTGAHFAGEYFKNLTGTYIVHIPYRSTSSAIIDVAAGALDMTFDATVKPYVDAGRVRLLAVADRQRDPRFPDTPTTAQAGLADFVMTSWLGLFARAGTPPAAVDRVNAAVHTAMADAGLRKRLLDMGIAPRAGTPAELTALLVGDMQLHRSILQRTRMTVAE